MARQPLPGALDAFRAESAQWEGEVSQLFADLDDFLVSNPPPPESGAPQLVGDLADLRSLVEQQTEVLTALVNALAGETPPPAVAEPPPEDTDDVIDAFLERVEQLQQVADHGDLN